MDKPTKPNISIPESFANNGTKTDFSETKIENGFERFTPEVLAGDNLNKFIDDTYKGLNYSIKTSDAVNLINDEEILTIQNNSFRTLPLQNPLAYSTGKTSEDNILFNELKKRKRSTFDLSKFEVVGSPVITDDGIASGLNSSNYLTIPLNISGSDNIDLEFEWQVDETDWSGAKIVLGGTNDINKGTFQIYHYATVCNFAIFVNIDDTATIRQRGFSDNVNEKGTYKIHYQKSNTTHTVTLFKPNGTSDTIEYTGATGYGLYISDTQRIGYSTNTNTSINLKQISLLQNGKEAFSGNKTGLDVIKPDNYEVVGSPTISDDGVASGFNTENTINLTFTLDSSSNNIDYVIKNVILTDDTGTRQYKVIFGSSNANRAKIGYVAPTRKLQLYTGSNWTGSDYPLSLNTSYDIKLNWNGSEYTLYAKLSGELTWTQVCSYTATENVLTSNLFLGRNTNRKDEFLSGSIDLNAFKIYVDGDLVYQPCLKIPYTQSKTGSKIVDEVYRDRVIDLYEQQGQAGYYTIDEENKNFTLPMGEIYGMIESKGSSSYHPPLLSTLWSDHILNDMSWLRADTFSWQDGNTYSQAYNELLTEYNDSASVSETEGSITFKRTPKGYKIALAEQETTIAEKYATDGIAWYYILDTTNKKFKLPRTKFGFEGLRNTVGNDISESLPNIKGDWNSAQYSAYWNSNGAIYGVANHSYEGGSNTNGMRAYFDASRSSSTYQDNAPVQERATQMYLYFYVGEFTKSAEAQTAGLKAELLNNKLDLNANNLDVSGKSLISGLGMPSDKYVDLTLGASGSTYTAPANGWVNCRKTLTGNGGYIVIANITKDYWVQNTSYYSGHVARAILPVSKGDIFYVEYDDNTGGTVKAFKFIYAEGSKED